MAITTIAFDADDTLWHHDNYFNEATHIFHTIMNEVGDYPDAGTRGMAQHVSDLPLWGYGVKSFTLSLVEAAIAMTKGNIDGKTIKRILDVGRSLYQHPIILLDHVAETIEALRGQYRLFLITKGDLAAQEMKIAQSKLAPFFEMTEIVSEKDAETYRRLCHRNHIIPEEMIMVGNSVKSDIIPVLQIGGQGIHVPYQTTWQYEQAAVAAGDNKNYLTLQHIGQLPDLLGQLRSLKTDRLADLLLPTILQETSASL